MPPLEMRGPEQWVHVGSALVKRLYCSHPMLWRGAPCVLRIPLPPDRAGHWYRQRDLACNGMRGACGSVLISIADWMVAAVQLPLMHAYMACSGAVSSTDAWLQTPLPPPLLGPGPHSEIAAYPCM